MLVEGNVSIIYNTPYLVEYYWIYTFYNVHT